MTSQYNTVDSKEFKGVFYIPISFSAAHVSKNCFREILTNESNNKIKEYLKTFISLCGTDIKGKYDHIMSFTNSKPKNDFVVIADLEQYISQLPKLPFQPDFNIETLLSKYTEEKQKVLIVANYTAQIDTKDKVGKDLNIYWHLHSKELEYKDNTFDRIFLVKCLSNESSISEFLQECQRVLAPNGKIIVQDHDTTQFDLEEDISHLMSCFITIVNLFCDIHLKIQHRQKYWKKYTTYIEEFAAINMAISPENPKYSASNITQLFTFVATQKS
jgi:SAM-dependent methyltransferase